LEKLAVLASGRGTDFQSILDHIRLNILQNIKMVVLISNEINAFAIKRAQNADVKTEYIEGIIGKNFKDKTERIKARHNFDNRVIEILKKYGATVIALAGFNQIVSSALIDEFNMKILNIHPAYDTKKYGGIGMVGDKVHQAVLANRESFSGCTVHYVDNTVDLGPIIFRQKVQVKKNDTVRSLADRILVWEHRTYSKAIQMHVDKKNESNISLKEKDTLIDWEIDWNRRQKRYLEYQSEHSDEMYGKELNNIL